MDGRSLSTITLDCLLEALIADSVVQTQEGSYLNVDPATVNSMLNALRAEVERVSHSGMAPVVLCSAKVRRHLKQVSAAMLPRLAVFSYNEIGRDIDIQMVGRVSLDSGAANDAGADSQKVSAA